MGDILDGEEEAWGRGRSICMAGAMLIHCKQPALPPPISPPSAMGGGK